MDQEPQQGLFLLHRNATLQLANSISTELGYFTAVIYSGTKRVGCSAGSTSPSQILHIFITQARHSHVHSGCFSINLNMKCTKVSITINTYDNNHQYSDFGRVLCLPVSLRSKTSNSMKPQSLFCKSQRRVDATAFS
jgi:hypothetical protein